MRMNEIIQWENINEKGTTSIEKEEEELMKSDAINKS